MALYVGIFNIILNKQNIIIQKHLVKVRITKIIFKHGTIIIYDIFMSIDFKIESMTCEEGFKPFQYVMSIKLWKL